ncbi:MAG: precorrin-6Y C5,15-methyltransferase (decarboxylating) subunit CbiT, partial [Chloroflexi bacterium]|nr:precorrin-6Y C5,15-methyltransferase (decarboxylating) subunit CbiT [Chloroflexota bacterium]
MILIKDDLARDTQLQHYFGIPDDEFQQQGKGLITKMEVRAVTLAKMHLKEDSIVWDIGAGSGSISIEAAFLAKRGSVFAIEKEAAAVAVIRENIQRFGRDNITVVETLAPENLDKLPEPTSVFIGGSGGHLMEILEISCRRLKHSGRIVINAATLETLQAATEGLKANGFTAEVTLVNVARSQDILNLTRLEALNPVFVVSGWRATEPPAK